MPYALLLFIIMPIVEIAVLIKVGTAIGVFTTIAIVVLTAIIGTAMLRQQGLATLARARERMGSGEMPAQQMIEGVLLLIGGVLLLTPGFVTDTFGFICLIPATRGWLARQVTARAVVLGPGGRPVGGRFGGRFGTGPGGDTGAGPGRGAGSRSGPGPFSGSGNAAGNPGGDTADGAGGSGDAPKRPATGDIIDGDYRRVD